MAQSPVTGGYVAVCLTRDGKSRSMTVHPLVLAAFVGPRPDGAEGCHENGVRSDCRLANLRWDTKAGNWADRFRHGTDFTGEHHPNAALSDTDVVAARARFVAGESVSDLALAFGMSRSGMSNVLTGACYSHIPTQRPAVRRHGNARLTVEEVSAIRARFAGGETKSTLAREYGVSASTVGRIVGGVAWREA